MTTLTEAGELAELADQLGTVVDEDQGDDPDAPYGRKSDGTPRRKPGPPAGAGRTMPAPRARRTNRRTAARPGAVRAAAGPAAAAAPTVDPVMVAGAQAILGLPTRALALAGMATGLTAGRLPAGSDQQRKLGRLALALSADAATLILHGDRLAEGMASMSDTIPWLAGVYAKAAQVGPYAAVLEAGAGVVLQMLCNHGLVPATAMLGTVDPAELVTQVMGVPAGG